MSTDTFHPDMETDILQHLHESAMRNFDLGNYFEAEALLEKLLNLSEAKYGPQFQGRDATRQTLIAALCKQGKLDDAERVLAKYGPQFECKAEPLEILATACCNENKLGKAEFFLLELLKDPTTQPLQRSTAMHDLAAIYLNKNDLEAAEEYCKQSVEERESILGEGHPFVYQSITLLGRIYAIKDNLQECVELEELCQLETEEAATKLGIEYLNDLGPEFYPWELREIKDNIRKSGKGLAGSGYGYAIIHAFAEYGNEEAVRILLQKGAYVDAKDGFLRTALSFAVQNGHVKAVQLLSEKGADLEQKDSFGQTVLGMAVQIGNEDVVRVLLKNWACFEAKDNEGQSVLSLAVQNGHLGIVRLLLEEGADIEAKDNLGWTALGMAIHAGRKEVVRILLERGANIEAKIGKWGATALSVAAGGGNYEVVQILLEWGADIEARTDNGHTALSLAAGKLLNLSVVEMLLEKGANIESKNLQGRTVLSSAVLNRDETMVRSLLQRGACIDAKDNQGQTALSLAVQDSMRGSVFGASWHLIKVLLDNGADVEVKNSQGRTLLSVAAMNNDEFLVHSLLERGACIDAMDNDGNTALRLAVQNWREGTSETMESVLLLMQKGAFVTKEIRKQVLDLARPRGSGQRAREALVELLTNKKLAGKGNRTWYGLKR